VPQSKIDMIRNWTDHVLDSARKNGYKFGTPGYRRIALSLSNRIQLAGHSLSIQPVGDSLNTVEFNPYVDRPYDIYSYWNGTHHMLWLNGSTENRGNYVKQVFIGTAGGKYPLYRFFNGITGCHLFTADANEAYALANHPGGGYEGWYKEGVETYVDLYGYPTAFPIFRFHKVQNGPEDYYYSQSSYVAAAGYNLEGVGFIVHYNY